MRRFIVIALVTAAASGAGISVAYARGADAYSAGKGAQHAMRAMCRDMVRAKFCGGAQCPAPGRHHDVQRCVQNGGRLD